MHAVIPAAGKGTRLRPHTAGRPKGLVDVAGRPILTHCFEQVLELPVDELVVIVGYEGQKIVDHYGDSFHGVPLSFVWQHEQNGLAHAVLQTQDVVDEAFVLLNGDNVLQADLEPLVDACGSGGADGAVLVEEVSAETAQKTGVLDIEDGQVVDVVEKSPSPPSRLANAGCYCLPPEIFQACALLRPGAEGEYQLSDAVSVLCRAGYTVTPVELDGWRVNVNTPADIERAKERLQTDN